MFACTNVGVQVNNTYDYILEKIVRKFNCTLLYRLYDVLSYYIIVLYSVLMYFAVEKKKKKTS